MVDDRPVGVFDSGVGGLSILAEIHRLLPAEDVVYLADQAWAPYGDRTLEDLQRRSFAVVDHLLDRGAKLVVVACNTASAAALHPLRDRHPDLRFVGMEPAVKPAAIQSDRKVVGVLATSATFQGELYASVVDRHAVGVTVVEVPGPGLVELIEAGELDGPRLDALLVRHLAPLLEAGIDTLVLGCTHYPFIADPIRRILGPGVRLIDPAPAVARQLGRVLAVEDLAAAGGEGDTTYLTTGDPAHFALQAERLLGVEVPATAACLPDSRPC
jgi:glutamate racemase